MFNTSLPTDNLYKFMAIAGVSIVLFSYYLTFARTELGWERAAQLERQSRVLIEEEEQIKLALEKLKDKTGARARALEDTKNDLAKRKIQIHQDSIAAMRSVEMTQLLTGQMIAASRIGIFLAVIGFSLWYWRVQRYLDIAIKKQTIN